MHEVSLVRALLLEADRVREMHDAARVTAMTVEIGPLSGAEPLLVESAFRELTAAEGSQPPELVIRTVDLTFLCSDCRSETATSTLQFSCEFCGGNRLRILKGDRFMLADVTLDTGEAAAGNAAADHGQPGSSAASGDRRMRDRIGPARTRPDREDTARRDAR